jgi:hypothetical protein
MLKNLSQQPEIDCLIYQPEKIDNLRIKQLVELNSNRSPFDRLPDLTETFDEDRKLSGKDSGLESLSAIDSRYAFRGILLNILQIIFSITEPQTRRSRHLLQMGNHFQEFSEMKVPLNIASST